MTSTSVPSGILNIKALNEDNYEHWSCRVKTYLLAEDLWDLVEGTNEPPKLDEFKVWRKNNARALQAITVFCGEDAESLIRGMTAGEAWNTLAEEFKIPEISEYANEKAKMIGAVCEVDKLPVDPTMIASTSKSAFATKISQALKIGTIKETAGKQPHKKEENSGTNADDENSTTDGDDDADSESAYCRPIEALFSPNVEPDQWEAIRRYVEQHPKALRTKYGFNSRTALHHLIWHAIFSNIPVSHVKDLVKLMKNKDFKIKDDGGVTALYSAIQWSNSNIELGIEIVTCIVEENNGLLLCIVDPFKNTIPLLMALSLQNLPLARYLYNKTPIDMLNSRDRAELISTCLRSKYFDIVLHLLRRFPVRELAITDQDHSLESPLNVLASTRADLFVDASNLRIWEQWIYNCIKKPEPPPIDTDAGEIAIDMPPEGINGRLYEMKSLHVQNLELLNRVGEELREYTKNKYLFKPIQQKLVVRAIFQAVERGHVSFINQIIDTNKEDIRWFFTITNKHDKTVFQFAAEHRQDKIFHMMDQCFTEEEKKEIIHRKDKFGNNMLHVVGRLSSPTHIAHIRGAALQMQYELQWFKKVERMSSPSDLNQINSDGLTPHEVFTMNHRDLVKEGESSLKETATSSSALVAALIITIMFAAAITIPGGIKGETGIPIYLDTKAFKIFIVADVISLCSSTASVMIFLGILTSRFAEEDFLRSLPKKLIVGFLTLFLSIGAMMVAFSSAIAIMLPGKRSIVVLSIILCSVPIVLFPWMQFPFLWEVIVSTYQFRVLKRLAGRCKTVALWVYCLIK